MRSKREHVDYINDMITSIKDASDFTKNMSYSKFFKDKKTRHAVVRCLEILGEASKNVPADIKKHHPNIPWKKISGLRNRIAHEYFNIDMEIVWKVVKEELPGLLPDIKKILKK